MYRHENRSMPKVESGFLYTDIGGLPVGTGEWNDWLDSNISFYFQSPKGTFTARKELRSGSWYWYAYRRYQGKLFKLYLGRSIELSSSRLAEVAELLDLRVADG